MEVILLHNSPIVLLVKAIRRCADSEDQMDSGWNLGYTSHVQYLDGGDKFFLGEKDKELFRQVIKNGHVWI